MIDDNFKHLHETKLTNSQPLLQGLESEFYFSLLINFFFGLFRFNLISISLQKWKIMSKVQRKVQWFA